MIINPVTIGDILVGYNAKQLGLSLEETVFGAFMAQTGIESIRNLGQSYSNWRQDNYDLQSLIDQLHSLPSEVIVDTFNNEIPDKQLYYEGYNMNDISPSGILLKG